jgi:tetratricopeptide (TPR) repeat protein
MIDVREVVDPERLINAALDARDAGRGADAVPLLVAALDREPRNARLWQTLGGMYRALEQSANAVEAFAKARQLSPGDPKPAHGVAQASLEAGRPSSVLFEQARKLAPQDGSLWLGWAAAKLAEGRIEEAVATMDAAVCDNPLWLEGQSTLARLRWQTGDVEDFAAGYTRAVRSLPGAAPLWLGLIDLQIHVRHHAQAVRTIADARAVLGAIDPLLPLEAVCASELGEREVADALYMKLAGSPDLAVAEGHLRHLLRTGRPDEAAVRAEPLLEHNQANRVWPYAGLAWRLTQDPRLEWLEGDPALIGVTDLDVPGLLAPLADRLRAIHRPGGAPLGQSVSGGTQTDGPLFAREEPEIQQLRSAIVEAVERHISTIGARDPAHPTRRHVGKRSRFAGSWSVRLTGAGHHSNHIHPQGWISSAFYVDMSPQAEMGPAPSGWLQLGAPPLELDLDLPAIRMIEPKAGRLVLFPSTMWHGTLPIEAGERLTVAFDVAPVG